MFAEDLFERLFAGGGVVFGFGGEGAVGFVVGEVGDGFLGLGDGFWEVGGGYLEAVEEEAGAAGVEVVGGDAVEDFGEGELDGGAVFERADGEGGLVAAAAVELVLGDGAAGGVVEVAERFGAEGGGAAAVAGGMDVAAVLAGFGLGFGHDGVLRAGLRLVWARRKIMNLTADSFSADS